MAIVDSRPLGGTCALRGCDPKKVRVGAAEALDWIRRMKGKGIQSDKLQIDWRDLMRFKRSFTEPVPRNREEGFAKAGITAFHGRAHLVGTSTGVSGSMNSCKVYRTPLSTQRVTLRQAEGRRLLPSQAMMASL